jgi:PAS domain S-box-containing protein
VIALRSIRQKVVLIILAVTVLASGSGFVVVILRDLADYRSETRQRGILQAQLVGQSCIPALTFDDPAGAEQLLSSLSALPDFRLAALFDDENRLFTRYPAAEAPPPPPGLASGSQATMRGSLLQIQEPLVHRGRRLGTLVLSFSLEELERKTRFRVLSLAALLVVLVAVAYVLAHQFQKLISVPILRLTAATEHLSAGGDLSLRLERQSQDEIGILYDRFNEMLGQLEARQEERDRVEEELTSARNNLRNVFDSLTSMLISIDREGHIAQWNSAAEKSMGIPWTEVVGRVVWEVIPFLAPYRSHLMATLATQKPVHLHREQIGGERPRVLDIDIFPFVQDGSQGAALIIDDVTDLAQKDEQLRQAQKMETVGTLAGGLAHDFNNYLGGIVGRVSLLQHRIRSGVRDPVVLEHDLKIMEGAANRAADMVQQLMSLSRKREISLQPVDLNRAVEHVLRIYRHTIDKSIDVKSVPSSGLALIRADPAQVEQVLLNLCINAAHAMTIMRPPGEPPGGELSIAVQKVHADAAFTLRHSTVEQDDYWCVRISDTGVGIAPEILPKVFDPFFSGKAAGQGSGLGLSIVYTIIQQHRGFIDVYSEVGVGTTFSIALPALVGNLPAQEQEDVFDAIPRGSGLVLVIDDEDVVRQTASAILEECGYEVLTACDGVEGLETFRQQHAGIGAVLLDMAMPKMSGRECFAEIKRIDPKAKVILASGFRHDQRVTELLKQGVDGFLQKPYTMIELARAMSELLKR